MVEHEIISPIPGVFYRRPTPEDSDYFAPGDSVNVGDVIGLVEVMKQFSEVTTDYAGILLSYNVGEGESVDPGQVIAVIQTVRED